MAEPRGDRKLRDVTYLDGIEVKPVYGPADVAGLDYGRDLGDPGEYPFTRGIHPLMYRKRRGRCASTRLRDTGGDQRALQVPDRQRPDGLNVAFDLPTQFGLDSDDPLAEGEVGPRRHGGRHARRHGGGLRRHRPRPDHRLADDQRRGGRHPWRCTSRWRRSAASPWDRLRATAQNDILKEFVGRGTWIFPVEPSIRLVGDTHRVLRAARAEVQPGLRLRLPHPRVRAHPGAGDGLRASASPAPTSTTCSRAACPSTSSPRACRSTSTSTATSSSRSRKFRAGRRLWARIMKERYGAQNPRSMLLRMIAGGGGGGLTIEQPENNIVRGAYYALASALPGPRRWRSASYDEAYTIPRRRPSASRCARCRSARRRWGVADTVDPLAGSYFVETLTNEMEARIRAEMERVERRAGSSRASSRAPSRRRSRARPTGSSR